MPGIIQITPSAGVWTQLPAQTVANQVMFQKGSFSFAFSATPGNNFFAVNRDDPPLTLTAGQGVSNTNLLWVRNNGGPLTLCWG
jgi:hypothetical protein